MSGPAPGRPPAMLIAATHSGAGKTTATAALLRALRRRGLAVQPFKHGPDFIDAAYHAEAAGRPSINLDRWMMGARGVRASFARACAGADVAVIEAMGALHDDADGTARGSPAELAALLDVPVVVVLDVWGMTRTAGALLDGLARFDPRARIAGCILNRVGSARHAELVRAALPARWRRRVVGVIEHRPELAIPERHLGLVTVEESADAADARARAQERAGAGLDLDALLALAAPRRGRAAARAGAAAAGAAPGAGAASGAAAEPTAPGGGGARAAGGGRRRRRVAVAVARDAAFCFTYADNLALLRDAGAELLPFSPLRDRRLPAGAGAVYLPGGYPESFAAELAANGSLAAELRAGAAAGLPVYAECGGLLYLARSLTGFDGRRHAMAGLLPLDVAMDPAHLAIAYVAVRTRADTPLGRAGTRARGQLFHQSRVVGGELAPTLYELTTSDGRRSVDGWVRDAVVASYVHLHFASNRRIADRLVAAAAAYAAAHA